MLCRAAGGPTGKVFQLFLRSQRVMNILKRSFRNALTVTIVVALSVCAAPGSVSAQQSGSTTTENKPMSGGKSIPPAQMRTREGGIIVEIPVLMVVPPGQSEKLAMEKGCWVRLYDKKDFNGDTLLLIGPVNLARMIGPFGVDWENKVRSLKTGPNSNLTIF